MKKQGLATKTAIAALLVYLTGPTFAQEDAGGLKYSLGVQQGFRYGDNVALGVPGSLTNPEEGTSSVAETAFALNISSETRTQRFVLETGAAFRFGSFPAGNTTDTGFVDPFVGVSYSRDGANARFQFDLNYSETGIASARPLWDFTDENFVIAPPVDLSSLQGTGTRRFYDFESELETGVNAPLGFLFVFDREGVDYRDTTSTGLTEFDRTSLDVSTFLRFSPVTTAVLDLGVARYENKTTGIDRDSRTAQIGLDRTYAASSLGFRIGYTDGDRDAASGSTSRGSTGSLNYEREMPNGSLGANYKLSRASSGLIREFSIGRSYVLPLGSLEFTLGASSVGNGDYRPTGSLGLVRDTQAGQYSLRLDRTVAVDANDEDRFTTVLALQYSQSLTPVSSFTANFSYFLADGTTASNEVERRNLALGYQYALTPDWNLNAGISFSDRDEANVGKAESHEIYFSLSRRFDFR